MNLSFATIGGGSPWPRSKPSSVSEPGVSPLLIMRSEVRRIFLAPTPSYWGLLKQPYKQKLATDTGRSEIYVQGFNLDPAQPRGKWQVSTRGGLEARWRHDGKEL